MACVRPAGAISPGPFFVFSDGRPLVRERFVNDMIVVLGAIVAESYAGHSFRIGAATTAARCGMPDSLIKTPGRDGGRVWHTCCTYIRTPHQVLCSVAQSLTEREPHPS